LNVTANTPPLLGTYPASEVAPGATIMVTPSAPPSDNGTLNVALSAPGFDGVLAIDGRGVITVSHAGPNGVHTITVTATDNCGAISTSTFVLTVAPPRRRSVSH
jgi:hypothetical protein